MWFQKRKPAQNVSLKKILSKISLFCQTRPRPPSPKFEMWFQKRKPAQNVSLKKILSKISLFCQTRPRPPLTQIRNVVSKEETCPKRFSQKDSLKTILSKRFSQNDSLKKILSKLIGTQTLNNFYKPCGFKRGNLPKTFLSKRFSQKFLSSVKRGPAPPHPNSKCGFKRGNLLKTILSKRFSQKESLKKILSKLVGTQTLNNFYKRRSHRQKPAPSYDLPSKFQRQTNRKGFRV